MDVIELVEVNEDDREAASNIIRWQQKATNEWHGVAGDDGGPVWQFFSRDFPNAIIRGVWDQHEVVQAFARHRIAALRPT